MNFLLDTCVLSELTKPKPGASVISWLSSISDDALFISSICIGEICKGIERLPEGAKKQNLNLWFYKLQSQYANRIISFDSDCAVTWGHLLAQIENHGFKMPVIDSMIASTALQKGFTLVTRNIKDYENSNVLLFNPFLEE